MARNRRFERGDQIPLTIAGAVGGSPGVYGDLPYVCQVSTDADGIASVQCDGVFYLTVTGANAGGNAAIAPGQKVYINGTTINADNTQKYFGYCLDAVASGATVTASVKLGA